MIVEWFLMKKTVFQLSFIVCFALVLSGCAGPDNEALTIAKAPPAPTVESVTGDQVMLFAITSPAFAPGEAIPVKFTCDGEDISPPLRWDTPPDGARSLVLIMDDPDAPVGTWVHWVVFNLPPDAPGLPENAELPKGSGSGQNSWGRLGYGGPCPPRGTHRYFFKLYALDMRLNLPDGASKEQLLKVMGGRILAQGELMGTYSKQ